MCTSRRAVESAKQRRLIRSDVVLRSNNLLARNREAPGCSSFSLKYVPHATALFTENHSSRAPGCHAATHCHNPSSIHWCVDDVSPDSVVAEVRLCALVDAQVVSSAGLCCLSTLPSPSPRSMYPYEAIDRQATPRDGSGNNVNVIPTAVSSFFSRNATPLLALGAVLALSLPAYRIYQTLSTTKPPPPTQPPTTPPTQPSAAYTPTTNTTTTTTTTTANPIRLGTRTSQLAMWQARHVAGLLGGVGVDVVGMNTMGDIDQIKPLTSFDSKGVFTKELDVALLASRIDAAVHCMKDLPTTLPPGLVMAAVLERGEMSDALIVADKHIQQGRRDLATLPPNAVIGTSALRRRAMVARHYNHLTVQDIRGNVNTRLAKLDRGEYDAVILAAVGLKRIGLEGRITMVLDEREYGYAVGQGALAVLAREGSVPVTCKRGMFYSGVLLAD